MRKLSAEEKNILSKNMPYLLSLNYTQEQYWHAYQFWARGGNSWRRFGLCGTYIMAILQYYHTYEKPNCREWRPSIIIKPFIENVLFNYPDTNAKDL